MYLFNVDWLNNVYIWFYDFAILQFLIRILRDGVSAKVDYPVSCVLAKCIISGTLPSSSSILLSIDNVSQFRKFIFTYYKGGCDASTGVVQEWSQPQGSWMCYQVRECDRNFHFLLPRLDYFRICNKVRSSCQITYI